MFQDYNFAISGESFQTLVPAILIIKLSRHQRAKSDSWAREFPSQDLLLDKFYNWVENGIK